MCLGAPRSRSKKSLYGRSRLRPHDHNGPSSRALALDERFYILMSVPACNLDSGLWHGAYCAEEVKAAAFEYTKMESPRSCVRCALARKIMTGFLC